MSTRIRIILAVIVILLIGGGVYVWATSGRESTDDAQVDAHVTPVAAQVGGSILKVSVVDNQRVEAGAELVSLDPRDYEIAVARAQAELGDARAEAAAAQASVPITSATATSNVSTARGGVAQAESGVVEAQHDVEVAKARLMTAQARQREQEANAAKAARDVERLKALLAKDEIAQQQFDAVVAAADASRAAVESARAQVTEAEAAIRAAESRLTQAGVGREQAGAQLRSAQTAPQQVAATRARAEAAAARVSQAETALLQARLNLERAVIKAPVAGIVSRKSVEPGQVIQAGQPLMALVDLERVWITANFKETQLESMKPGQKATVEVDALGGREFEGHVDSIAAATGAKFSLLPPENATGNFVKVVQRIPVKIVLESGQDSEHLLRPGMSVTPTVRVR